MSTVNDTVAAVLTALARCQRDKRNAFEAAREADKTNPSHATSYERARTFNEHIAVMDAAGNVIVALIESGVDLDDIRRFEAQVSA